MTLAGAEVPRGEGGGREGMPTVDKQNRGLYKLVLWFLGIALLVSIGGWIAMVIANKNVPEALPVMIATIVGGFVGVISSDKTS
jgi:hypothetical protein